MVNRLKKLFYKDKALFLAYDQGLEHGPTDFNDENIDPNFIIKIAKQGKYNGLIFQKGIAEQYNKEIKKSKIPLIIKLNGKTNLYSGEALSRQICSVDEAIKLGAKAVGYTIYIGSEYENVMLQEFSKIEFEAHKKGIPVIAWIYPRGTSIAHKSSTELMAYAARCGLEIGADIIKLVYHGDTEDLKWAVKAAGKTKVLIAGGTHTEEHEFLENVKEIIDSGCAGLAVGRNVWQAKDPLRITKHLKKIIWK